MKIHKVSKDNLHRIGKSFSLVDSNDSIDKTDSPLKFWTQHATKPCFVDLTDLENGQKIPKKAGHEDRWLGGYSGRPSLIHELLPAIKEKLMWATAKTCLNCVADLKSWWRLFDEIETNTANTLVALGPTRSVKDLTHLHQQLAVQRFSPNQFSAFRSVADATRRALGMKPLAWNGPEQIKPSRDIPTSAQSRTIFTHIKRAWFQALDRWNIVDELLAEKIIPANEQQAEWLLNAKFLLNLIEGGCPPTTASIKKFREQDTGKSHRTMWRDGLTIDSMFEVLFPTAFDIRMGFHLALIGGGWNVQTLLDLRVNPSTSISECTPFLRDHPQDSSRYIITGYKERGGSYHVMHGDWKSDRSPGRVIRTIIERTWPLRQEIVRLLRLAELKIDDLVAKKADAMSVTKARLAALELQRKSQSIWLYRTRSGIQALHENSYDKYNRTTPILHIIIDQINSNLNGNDLVPKITASDFRDVFAEYVYRISGGSVLAVQKALGHLSASTTAKYIDNKLINAESARTFVSYTNEMWSMCLTSGQLDHTTLRQIMEREHITPEQQLRLAEYRKLKKSRLGVGCKDPRRPPARLDPQFTADGRTLCTAHRCTLCLENAVIAPEALEGLAMRLAELQHIKSRTPIEHFCRGGDVSWQAELQNTQTALLGFDATSVQAALDKWTLRIEQGEHRVPEFNGSSPRKGFEHE